MGKIERKYLAHFINTAEAGEASYERLGKDLEEFNAEMSAQVETKRNILGETSVVIAGYEKTGAVEPYYAEEGSGLFARLQKIIDGNLVLDRLLTDVVEVKLWNMEGGMEYPAIREKAYIEVVSYGGDISGYQIPFNLHFTGEKEQGTFELESKTFTPA